MAHKPILISGAGIGGTLLARSLRSNNIPFHLYERDPNPHARAQGYRIRISNVGLDALKEVLSEDEYKTFHSGTATTGGGGIHTLDAITGNNIEKPTSGPGAASRPGGPGLGGDVLGVARGWLRQCLISGLEDVVHWGKRSAGYTLTDSGVVINFADGTSSPEGSLLVAVDGPQSALAKQLGGGKIRAYDTGARMIHGQTTAKAFEPLGVGVWAVQDGTHTAGKLNFITNIRPGEEKKDVEFGWIFAGGPGTFEPPNGNFSIVGKQAAEMSRELTAGWHEKFQAIFKDQNDAEAAFLKMSTAWPGGLPEWENSPRVTVMGDTVHCMTPAGGVGANTALRDAALLGSLLTKAGGWRDGLTAEYEKEMLVYASENVTMSFEAAASQFGITELEGRPIR